MDAKNKKIPADCRLEIEKIDFKIELKNFIVFNMETKRIIST